MNSNYVIDENHELEKLIQISTKYSANIEKTKKEYNMAVDYFKTLKEKIVKKIKIMEYLMIHKNEYDRSDINQNKENLDKTNLKIHFSENKYDKSLIYT